MDKWRRISLLCGGLTILIGFIALLGWVFDIGLLRAFLSDGVNMKINTAKLLILCGVSLVALRAGYVAFPRVLLVMIQLFALAVIYEHISGTNLYIDEFIFSDRFANPKLEVPGRMSLVTALYILLGAAAMLLSSFKHYTAAQFSGATLVGFVYISLIGHLFHFTGFFAMTQYGGLAFHTAFCLLLLAAGAMLLEPDEGWIKQVYHRLANSNLLIYLVSYIVVVVPLFTAIYLFVLRNSSFAPASDMLVLFLLTIILSVPVAYFLLRLFNQLDEDVRGAHEQLRIAVHASGLGVWDMDTGNGALSHSKKFATFFGSEDVILKNADQLWNTFHPDDKLAGKAAFKQAIVTGQLDVQVRVIAEGDVLRWIQFYGETRRDRNGHTERLLGTAMDITARKEMERHKDEFISIASHELKTPLTSLKSYVQVAHGKSKVYEDTGIANMLAKAEVQINKMTGMIGDFLNAAHSEVGRMVLNKTQFPLDELIRDIIQDLSISLKGKQIFLDTQQPLNVTADREKIERVLVNLVNNAIKYSASSQTVTVNYQQTQDQVVIRINDQGVGIGDDDKRHLFDRFFRAENPNTRTVSGFGIGLYLCAEIVRLHGGNIGVDSEIGQGSSFWFSLPITVSDTTGPERSDAVLSRK